MVWIRVLVKNSIGADETTAAPFSPTAPIDIRGKTTRASAAPLGHTSAMTPARQTATLMPGDDGTRRGSGCALIAVVQAADLRHGHEMAARRGPDLTRPRAVVLEALMRARRVVVPQIAAQQPTKVPFAEHHDVVQTRTPNRAIPRSANGFCHGDRGAMRISRRPSAAQACPKSWP